MTLFLLALALAMDAFAVAVARGAIARHPTPREALRVGLAFGAAQGLMPLVGWTLGIAFASAIRDVDHWIAFGLLALVGVRMIYVAPGQSAREDASPRDRSASRWALFSAAIATSVDAAAAGVTLPLLGQPVWIACVVIGGVTLVLSAAGVMVGAVAGVMIGRRAALFGGVGLIGIGIQILVEHLFFGG